MIWNGRDVLRDASAKLAEAFEEFGAFWAEAAKGELYPGHGYDTGRLQRSIGHEVTLGPDAVVLTVGSIHDPVEYGYWVHEGHRGFAGYHYLTGTLERLKGILPRFIAEVSR